MNLIYYDFIGLTCARLKVNTHLLVFTRASGCRESETFDVLQCKLIISSVITNSFCFARQLSS